MKLYADALVLQAMASATTDNVSAVQALEYRAKALRNAVKVNTPKGQKAHTWLTQAQIKPLIGKPDLAPHDLRRAYAQLGYEAGVPITQISKLLGHVSVAGPQRHLNLDLESTVSGVIPF